MQLKTEYLFFYYIRKSLFGLNRARIMSQKKSRNTRHRCNSHAYNNATIHNHNTTHDNETDHDNLSSSPAEEPTEQITFPTIDHAELPVDSVTPMAPATSIAPLENAKMCIICQETPSLEERRDSNLTFYVGCCLNIHHVTCMKEYIKQCVSSGKPITCPTCRHNIQDQVSHLMGDMHQYQPSGRVNPSSTGALEAFLHLAFNMTNSNTHSCNNVACESKCIPPLTDEQAEQQVISACATISAMLLPSSSTFLDAREGDFGQTRAMLHRHNGYRRTHCIGAAIEKLKSQNTAPIAASAAPVNIPVAAFNLPAIPSAHPIHVTQAMHEQAESLAQTHLIAATADEALSAATDNIDQGLIEKMD